MLFSDILLRDPRMGGDDGTIIKLLVQTKRKQKVAVTLENQVRRAYIHV